MGFSLAEEPLSHASSSLDELKARLTPIPEEQGGGYAIDLVRSGRFTKEEFADIAKIPRIRGIYDLDDPEGWEEYYGNIKTLEEIIFQRSVVSDDHLSFLHRLRQLTTITIRGRYNINNKDASRELTFSSAPLAELREMTKLRQLTLISDKLADDALAYIGEAPQLLSLNLTGHFTNEGMSHLKRLTSLRRLSLTGDFDDDGLSHLASLSQLEALILTSNRLKGPGLTSLSKLPKLRLLKLNGFQSNLTLQPLETWPALEVLNLANEQLTDDILETLPQTNHLKSLSLCGSAITDQGLKALLRPKNLQELDLLLTKTTDNGLETVASCKTLEKLLLGGGAAAGNNAITDRGLRKLARLPKLESLDIRYVDIRETDFRTLAIPSLIHLNLGGKSDYVPNYQRRLHQLRQLLPNLAPNVTTRISIDAELLNNEYKLFAYDIYINQLKTESS